MSNELYKMADSKIWQGRKTDPSLGPLYYYQAIQIENLSRIEAAKANKTFGILSYECEEGIRRNQGRLGAVKGPIEIKRALGKLAFHSLDCNLLDLGSVFSEEEEMEKCQGKTAECISEMIQKNISPIVLGGGHDMAYAHYLGVQKALDNKGKVGVINFDAHFDLRKPDGQGNSGTPFYQCAKYCESNDIDFSYLAIGIQKESNTRDLFETAELLNVDFILNENCHGPDLSYVKDSISKFLNRLDHIYLTIDMDGFSSSYAPGVSAPSPLGFSPPIFFELFDFVMKSGKIISMDIAEMNPTYDRDHSTAKLTARIIDFYIRKSQG